MNVRSPVQRCYTVVAHVRCHLTEILVKASFIFGIYFHPLLEIWVRNKGNVRRQHHELSGAVLVLIRTVPWFAIVCHLRRPAFFQ